MDCVLRDATVYFNGSLRKASVTVANNKISNIFPSGGNRNTGLYIFPGFVDVHIHLREPGFSYKETILTGTQAAARGGYTTVCAMPNVSPVPDSLITLKATRDAINRSAIIRVLPYASITKGEAGLALSDFEDLFPYVVGFSDDGRGVSDEGLMREAMRRAAELGGIIAAHCEDLTLTNGGCIHDGEYAKAHGLRGIPSESEWRQIARDIALVRETKCRYHVCHVSCSESVALIRAAKAEGLDVTCETAPHYLLLDDSCLEDDGRFRMNPPLRAPADREALVEAVADGTIDMIATDHAPHSAEEKSRGLAGSVMGVVGLETAFAALYTGLVKTGIIPLEKLLYMLTTAPAERFGLKSGLSPGAPADLTVFDLNDSYLINPDEFLSKGKSTPFAGSKVFGRCLMTLKDGNIVWKDDTADEKGILRNTFQ